MNKVFIPDNEDGGTWETWKDDRPNYKAHAEKLAEALRDFIALDFAKASMTDIAPRINKSVQALAVYEATQ